MRKKLCPLPVLESERLILRQITPADEADMYDYSRDPETSRYLLWEPHSGLAHTRSHIQNLVRQYRALTFFDWALEDKKSGKMIGTAGFTRIFGHRRTAEIGYVLSPKFHRQGLAPEAVRVVLNFGFRELGLIKVYCRIMEDNEASRKVAQRLGFSFIGYENEIILKRGNRQKVARYELTLEQYMNNG